MKQHGSPSLSSGNLHSVVSYNFLNTYLPSLSALCSLRSVKCFHSIFSPPNFYFLSFQSLGNGGPLSGNHIFPAPDSCHSHSSLCFECVFSGQEQKGLSRIQIAGSAFPGCAHIPQVSLFYGGNWSWQLRCPKSWRWGRRMPKE